MFKNILTPNQLDLLPLVSRFAEHFYLVGGTAIALQMNHRKSIDFDLFTIRPLKHSHIKKIIWQYDFPTHIIFEDGDQLHAIIHDIKVTFYEYPYPIQPEVEFENIIAMPSLLSLAAMKVFALGQRAKWKDYVDMYFLLKDHLSLTQISAEATKLFGGMFNEKLLRQQLTYYKDVNYSEPIEYIDAPISNETIEQFLTSVATEEM